MPVPSVISDITVVANNNSPPGGETVTISVGPDEYVRAISAIVRREQAQGATLASAATVLIGATIDGNYIHISGVTTITAFGTIAAGIERTLVFDGILTLTHNATSLILPSAANIVTAVGDVAMFRSEGSGNWKCVSYAKASGAAVVAAALAAKLANLSAMDSTLGLVEQTGADAFTKRAIGGTTSGNVATVNQITTTKLPTIAATVATDALTLGVSAAYLDFSSATLASGSVSTILAAPVNIVVPSGATLGTTNAVESQIYLIVMNNAGTAELAVMNSSSAKGLNESRFITTTVLDAGSDSKDVAYSATARTALPFRVIGKVTSTQATAGLWATSPSSIRGVGGLVIPKRLLQNLNVTTGAMATGTGLIPETNDIPQITGGDQYMSLAITPTSTTSRLEIAVIVADCASSIADSISVALFRDAVANALASSLVTQNTDWHTSLNLLHVMTSGTTAEIVFRVRMGGGTAGTRTFNGRQGLAKHGGVLASSITIKEYAA